MSGTTPASAATPDEDVVLVSCMRNEGLFVLEWLAYHSLLGFRDIMVFTNNCTDQSDLLLDRLQALGHLTHVRHDPAPGKSPQINAMEIAFQHPIVTRSPWMLHIDADEFLLVQCGCGTIGSLIKATAPADVVAIAWNVFGNSGLTEWQGGSVLQAFTRCQGSPARRTVNHKSLFRHAKFTYAIDHMPKLPKVDDIVVKTTLGVAVNDASLHTARKSRFKMKFGQVTFANASLNHYALKSDDLYVMKNDRGDGNATTHSKYFLNSVFYRRHNRNEVENRDILALWPQVSAKMAALLQDPELRRLNDAVLSAYLQRRTQVLTPSQLAAWTHQPEDDADTGEDDE